MQAKTSFKNEAIRLRKKGLSYSEILEKVPVAKSTLSLWFQSIYLDENSKSILRKKLSEAQKLGARAKRRQRQTRTKKILKIATREIGKIDNKTLMLLGTMLYWGEGTKQKEWNVCQAVSFTNSDPLMCKLFIKWVQECLVVTEDRIVPRIYIHISQKAKSREALQYWSKVIGINEERFKKTCFTNTKHSLNNKRRKRNNYYGLLRINVKKSTDLNRRIEGWVNGVCIQSGLITSSSSKS